MQFPLLSLWHCPPADSVQRLVGTEATITQSETEKTGIRFVLFLLLLPYQVDTEIDLKISHNSNPQEDKKSRPFSPKTHTHIHTQKTHKIFPDPVVHSLITVTATNFTHVYLITIWKTILASKRTLQRRNILHEQKKNKRRGRKKQLAK